MKTAIPNIKPENLCKSLNKNELVIYVVKWIVKSYQTYLVTGDQGSGKTTFLKSICRYYDPSCALRINEIQPELNLRFAYPQRNILSFAETGSITTQDGLDFQKKTSGTVNVIGEIASALAMAWFLQTSKVASKSGAGTHHAKTVPDLISAGAMNLVQALGYSDEKSCEIMVADAIDFDIHMTREQGYRFCERITEINAIHVQDYPYPSLDHVEDSLLQRAIILNREEYQKRITDRTTFEYHDIVRYNREKQTYELVGWFSDETLKRIKKNLSLEDVKEFERECEIIKTINAMEI